MKLLIYCGKSLPYLYKPNGDIEKYYTHNKTAKTEELMPYCLNGKIIGESDYELEDLFNGFHKITFHNLVIYDEPKELNDKIYRFDIEHSAIENFGDKLKMCCEAVRTTDNTNFENIYIMPVWSAIVCNVLNKEYKSIALPSNKILARMRYKR